MFSFGIIGFFAGILYKKGILKARKADLCIYGFLSVVLIYGGIMNPASILMAYGHITKESLLAFYISGASGRSGTCSIYSGLFVYHEPAPAYKAGKDQGKIRAYTAVK